MEPSIWQEVSSLFQNIVLDRWFVGFLCAWSLLVLKLFLANNGHLDRVENIWEEHCNRLISQYNLPEEYYATYKEIQQGEIHREAKMRNGSFFSIKSIFMFFMGVGATLLFNLWRKKKCENN